MHKKQHTLWLLAALAAPLAHYSGFGWAMTLLVALAVLPLSLLPKCWDEMTKFPAVVQILWLGAVAGTLLRNSAIYWPSDNALVVPLVILALAMLTDCAAGPRVGAVLAFCMALPAVATAVSGAKAVEPGWLRPGITPWPWALTLAFLLVNLPVGKGNGAVYEAILGTALAFLTQGTISLLVAANVPDPFWQTARTLGAMEPVIAVGVTFGWYALAVYLLQSARQIGKSGGIKAPWAGVLYTGTVIILLLFKWKPEYRIMTLFSLFFWVFMPFLTKIKKLEKR